MFFGKLGKYVRRVEMGKETTRSASKLNKYREGGDYSKSRETMATIKAFEKR